MAAVGGARERPVGTHMTKYEKNRSTRRSTPRHPIAMASTAKPPDPMPCALAAILFPESRTHACHRQKTLFPGILGACGVRVCSGRSCVRGAQVGSGCAAGV